MSLTSPTEQPKKANTPEPIIFQKYPVVTFTMEDGNTFKAELYPDIAPNTVYNFISLIKNNYFEGSPFHRIIPGFMAQGGSNPASPQGPGYSIKGEFTGNGYANDLKHTEGVLSMARTYVNDSASSQFFIMFDAAPHLDGQYAAFGKIIEGMDYIHTFEDLEFAGESPVDPPVIKSVTVDTFGTEYPEPVKVK